MNEQYIALRKFGYQIRYAVEHFSAPGLDLSNYHHIIIGGLGGSGIGGRLVKNLFQDQMTLPVECLADYNLPAYANEKTLVILGSYSGNTEETLSMFEEVKARRCDMIIATSGGKLKALADENNLKVYPIEAGFQPRMALGFSLTYLILLFDSLLGQDRSEEMLQVAASFDDTTPYEEDAMSMFEKIKSKASNKLVVVTDQYFEATGIRFAQQIQENAKHECFTHVLPEANHNVIESYYGVLPSVYFFLDSGRNERVSARFEFLTNLLEVENHKVVALIADEFSVRVVYQIIHRLDWLSLYLADFRKVDSLNVPNIASLKAFLENV